MFDSEYEAQAQNAGRWDIYGPIHKALRLAHADLLKRLGSADWTDDQGILIADMREHLRLGAAHLAHEEAHIHPAVEASGPGALHLLAEQHESHRARFAVLEAQLGSLEAAARSDRPVLGRALYLGFTLLVAEDLAHMHEEETVLWPWLCARFTDDELKAMEMEIVGSLPPEDNLAFMRLMMPAISRAERCALLGGMKAAAPPEAYRAVIELAARPTLSPDDWAHLAAHGLVG